MTWFEWNCKNQCMRAEIDANNDTNSVGVSGILNNQTSAQMHWFLQFLENQVVQSI